MNNKYLWQDRYHGKKVNVSGAFFNHPHRKPSRGAQGTFQGRRNLCFTLPWKLKVKTSGWRTLQFWTPALHSLPEGSSQERWEAPTLLCYSSTVSHASLTCLKCKRKTKSNLDTPWDTSLSVETLLKVMWAWKVTAALLLFSTSARLLNLLIRLLHYLVKHPSLGQKFTALKLKKKSCYSSCLQTSLNRVFRCSAGRKWLTKLIPSLNPHVTVQGDKCWTWKIQRTEPGKGWLSATCPTVSLSTFDFDFFTHIN